MQENLNIYVAAGFWLFSISLLILRGYLKLRDKKARQEGNEPQNMSFVTNNKSTIFFG